MCINYLYVKDINFYSVISISKIYFNVLVYVPGLRKHIKYKRNLVVGTASYSVLGLINTQDFQAHWGFPVETSKQEK